MVFPENLIQSKADKKVKKVSRRDPRKHVKNVCMKESTWERAQFVTVLGGQNTIARWFFELQASTLQLTYELRGDVLAADMIPQASDSCLPKHLLNVMLWRMKSCQLTDKMEWDCSCDCWGRDAVESVCEPREAKAAGSQALPGSLDRASVLGGVLFKGMVTTLAVENNTLQRVWGSQLVIKISWKRAITERLL